GSRKKYDGHKSVYQQPNLKNEGKKNKMEGD
ncbi:hypothetical protein JL09_g6386, partial [Pichia kudriavzevii]